jgi:two-component system cell cycle sensor histidine kinase/response regulator CckA
MNPAIALTPGKNEKTILIVDDEPSVIEVVGRMLDRDSLNILTASSGSDALQRSREYPHEIHLLLTDFRMPRMSGMELATKITSERPGLKVLMMSGFSDGMLRLNEGWHFLEKPFVPSRLRALVEGLVFSQ